MIKKVIKLILIILWMVLIFSFSGDTGEVSTKKSDGFIIRMVETVLNRDLSDDEKEKWTTYLVIPVRKGAHLGVYLILGVLIINFVLEIISLNNKSKLISLIIAFLYACSDEIHQLLVPGRSGQISDVLLDTIGAVIGILVFSFLIRRRDRHEQEKRVG